MIRRKLALSPGVLVDGLILDQADRGSQTKSFSRRPDTIGLLSGDESHFIHEILVKPEVRRLAFSQGG